MQAPTELSSLPQLHSDSARDINKLMNPMDSCEAASAWTAHDALRLVMHALSASKHTCTVFPVPMSSAISALPLCLNANRTPSL